MKKSLRKIPPCSSTSAIRQHLGRPELQGVEDSTEKNFPMTVSAVRYSRGLWYFGLHALAEMQQNICLFSTVFLSSLPQRLFSPPSDVLTYIRKVRYLQADIANLFNNPLGTHLSDSVFKVPLQKYFFL